MIIIQMIIGEISITRTAWSMSAMAILQQLTRLSQADGPFVHFTPAIRVTAVTPSVDARVR